MRMDTKLSLDLSKGYERGHSKSDLSYLLQQ